jgi:hypothetical protein
VVSIVTLVCASIFAGAMLRPSIERWLRPSVPSAGELAAFLEHTVVDVRLGRAAPLAERLGELAGQIKEPVARERVLGLWAEAALQAGRLEDAAAAEGQREGLVDPGARNAIRLRRIGLAASLGQSSEAAELAKPLIGAGDPRIADEARLLLATAMTEKELRSWVGSRDQRDAEEARRAGLAALRLLGDAGEAERLLAPLERMGKRDASLYQALAEVYSKLGRPGDLARVAGALVNEITHEGERARVAILQANALASTGDSRAALAALDPLGRSRDVAVRRAGRRARYEVLQKAGRFQAELALLRDPAERAFVVLEVERNYPEAVRLYEAAGSAHPDSLEIAEGLHEAERRRDLAERRALYEHVLAKDPEDQATRDKLLAVLVGLGENEAARQWVDGMLRGREAAPEALVAVALSLKRAGLDRDATGYLEKAYAAESDVAKKQLVLFSLGELYAEARQEGDARRLYAGLAAEGVSPEIRERAVARLASLLR